MPNSISFTFWHNSNKINPYIIRVDFIFMTVKKYRPFQCMTFWWSHGVKWMTKILIFSVFHFEKNNLFVFFGDNINFSSLDLVIPFKNFISFWLKMFGNPILSNISNGTMRFFVRHNSKCRWKLFLVKKKIEKLEVKFWNIETIPPSCFSFLSFFVFIFSGISIR